VQAVLSTVADQAQEGVSTLTAPTPLPTQNPAERLVIASNAWDQGAIDDAITEYKALVEALPNDLTTHYRYTLGLLMAGRSQEALVAAENAVTANPFAADAWVVRSKALTANGRSGEGIASAMLASQMDPTSARALVALAEAYFEANQIDRAQATVEQALELNPESYEAYYMQGRIEMEANFLYTEARAAFQRAYDLAPNMPIVGIDLAWAMSGDEDPDAGFEILQQISESNPGNSNALFALGYFSTFHYGETDRALDFLNRCIIANPSSIACNAQLGATLYNRYGPGDVEAAGEAYMHAVELGTTNSRHYLSAGRIMTELNNCGAAVPVLRQGYQLEMDGDAGEVRLGEFVEALTNCGASVNAGSAPGPTQEAPANITPEATAEAGNPT
jgi:tetratricopeptide (TPR) repeat protein